MRTNVRYLGLGVALFVSGCGRPAPETQTATAVEVRGGETAFTTVRPLTPALLAQAESLRKAAAPRPTPRSGDWRWLNITYYGAPARISAWATDGSTAQDTTAPRDDACDGFAEQHANDPPESDGIGCLDQNRSIQLERIPPGEALIQFAPTDTGTIFFELEAYSGGAEHNRYWHGLEFRVMPGRIQRFRIRLPAIASTDSLLVESLSGAVDTVPLQRVDPDSARG